MEEIETIKKLLDIQAENLTDNYMIGMYNGFVVAYNSIKPEGEPEIAYAETIK